MGRWICWFRGWSYKYPTHNDRLTLVVDDKGCWVPQVQCLRCRRVESW